MVGSGCTPGDDELTAQEEARYAVDNIKAD